MAIQADRLYLGTDLIFQPGSDVIRDDFDRTVLGSDYTVVNTLNNGSAASASITGCTLVTTGYTPAAVRDFGGADGVLSARLLDPSATPHVMFRYVDINNWISWSSGRLRFRVAGVSSDLSVASHSTTAGDLLQVVLAGSSIHLLRNLVEVAAVTDSRHSTATRHGVGSASALGSVAFTGMWWDPA